MRQEILARLIGSIDFVTLKEVAAECLSRRGYSNVSDSDGWSDGGSDLRVYARNSVEPAKTAIQTSVEKDWKSKVRADAIKAKRRLGCPTFLYVSSRRIPDAEFLPIADDLEVKHGVRAAKMDQQDIAGFVLNHDLLQWFMGLLGMETSESNGEPASAAEEARDAYMLFSDEATRFREAMVQHALELTLARSGGPLGHDQLAIRSLAALGTTGKAMAELTRATIDRLIQTGRIVKDGAGLAVPQNVRDEYLQARKLVLAQWRRFIGELGTTLRPFLPRAASTEDAAKRLSQEMGSVVLRYREYQAALLSDLPLAKQVRKKYTAAVESTRAVLAEIGVASDKSQECVDAISALHQRYPLLDRLSAGEVFRSLLEKAPTSLFQVLGGRTSLDVVYDTPVAIPMICARLYAAVEDRYTLAAVRCAEIASGIGGNQLLPDCYLEECAAHLIDAGRYAPIFENLGATELEASENAYASYYSRLRGVAYAEFLGAFGYKSDDVDFATHRNLIATRLRTMFKKYGIQMLQLRGRKGDPVVRRQVETTLLHIYHDVNEDDRPEILMKHDGAVVQAVVEAAANGTAAQVLVTWDRTLFESARALSADWWCMDPASAADLFALALPGSAATTSVDVLLTVEDSAVKLSGAIWDTIVHLERGKLRDADLFDKAKMFKENFLKNQTSDKIRTSQIVEAWKRWKT